MPRNRDFVPRADIRLDKWRSQFVAFANAHAAELGITPAKLARLNDADAEWQAAWQGHNTAQKAARAATSRKNQARADFKTIARELAAVIQARSETTDEQRKSLGITVPDRTPTRVPDDEIMTLRPPLLLVDFSVRGQAVIHYGPNPADERNNAKPEGVHACSIQYCLGGIPKKGADWKFLAHDTASPYVHLVQPEPGQKSVLVAYRACWLSVRMRPGPFGDPEEVTISF